VNSQLVPGPVIQVSALENRSGWGPAVAYPNWSPGSALRRVTAVSLRARSSVSATSGDPRGVVGRGAVDRGAGEREYLQPALLDPHLGDGGLLAAGADLARVLADLCVVIFNTHEFVYVP
jgi:hypothetical protein